VPAVKAKEGETAAKKRKRKAAGAAVEISAASPLRRSPRARGGRSGGDKVFRFNRFF
jgi:hypothetical protein